MAKTQTKAGKAEHTDRSETPGATARKAAKPRALRLPKPVAAAITAARDKKAVDLVVLDLRKAGGFTGLYFACERYLNG